MINSEMPTMVTIAKAHQITKLSERSLRKLCKENKIIYILIGRKVLINLEKLNEYLCTVQGNTSIYA